ncbi:MAG: hypothetical protein JWM57_968 [Phycisphaerales bacterium]|nr:hypothetical protein [Phycisphaerales bacterium]
MNRIWISSVALGLMLIAGGCKANGDSMNSKDSMHTMGSMPGNDKTMASSPMATTMPMQMYTCTMHPDVVVGTPGKCPKCGMELVPKK